MHPVANRVNPARPRSFRRGLGLEKGVVVLVVLRAHVLTDLPFRITAIQSEEKIYLAKSAKNAKEEKIVGKQEGQTAFLPNGIFSSLALLAFLARKSSSGRVLSRPWDRPTGSM